MIIVAWDRENDVEIEPRRFPELGEWAAFIDGKNTTKKEYNVPSDVILKEHDERSWRDSELIRTDELVKLPDFPQDLLAYRQLLREYPQSNNFPNGVRPIINNIKVR